MTPSEIALFKEYRKLALESDDMMLYYYSELDRSWMSVNDEWILAEDGMLSEYIQEDVVVTIHDTGEQVTETHIVKHYYSYKSITAFKLVRMIQPIKATVENLEKLL